MDVRDAGAGGDAPRREAVVAALAGEELLEDERFARRVVAVSEEAVDVERLGGVDDLPPPGARSAIARTLGDVLGDVGDTSLAAAVLLSDGADNVGRIDPDWWARLAAAGVPVHTVGRGRGGRRRRRRARRRDAAAHEPDRPSACARDCASCTGRARTGRRGRRASSG